MIPIIQTMGIKAGAPISKSDKGNEKQEFTLNNNLKITHVNMVESANIKIMVTITSNLLIEKITGIIKIKEIIEGEKKDSKDNGIKYAYL